MLLCFPTFGCKIENSAIQSNSIEICSLMIGSSTVATRSCKNLENHSIHDWIGRPCPLSEKLPSVEHSNEILTYQICLLLLRAVGRIVVNRLAYRCVLSQLNNPSPLCNSITVNSCNLWGNKRWESKIELRCPGNKIHAVPGTKHYGPICPD